MENKTLRQIVVDRLWFNSFEDLVGLDRGFVRTEVHTQRALGHRWGNRTATAIGTSVNQGKGVAKLAQELGLPGNPPLRGLVMSSGTTPRAVPVARTLKLAVIGPNKDRVKDLEGDWVKAATTAALANVDDSVANLSSIVVLAEVKGQRMLLTGDARGEDILSGLRGAGLLDTSGRIHVDLLKLPHHGSDRNVDTDFFRSVTADSYVISGDGTDSNPELATLGMLTEARGRDAYTINFTNRETRIEEWFARNTRDTDRFSVRYRDDDKPSIMVHLAEPLQPGPS